MFQLIGGILKYSLLVVVVLVLSHVIQVQGVTISQHVLNGMHWVSGYSPKLEAEKITSSYSRVMQNHIKQLDKIEDSPEVDPADQQALNRVIAHAK